MPMGHFSNPATIRPNGMPPPYQPAAATSSMNAFSSSSEVATFGEILRVFNGARKDRTTIP